MVYVMEIVIVSNMHFIADIGKTFRKLNFYTVAKKYTVGLC